MVLSCVGDQNYHQQSKRGIVDCGLNVVGSCCVDTRQTLQASSSLLIVTLC
jgi:hypothetical protein